MESVILDMSERLAKKDSKSEMVLEDNNDRLASIDEGVRQIKEKESDIADILQYKVASNDTVKNIIVEGIADVVALQDKSNQIVENQKKMDCILEKSIETKNEVVNILERVAALVERVTCFVEKNEETNQNEKNMFTDALENSIAVNNQVFDTIVRLSGSVKEVAAYVQEKERCQAEDGNEMVACASLARKREDGNSASVQKMVHGNDTEVIKAKMEKVLTKIVETRGHMRSVMARVNDACDNRAEFGQIEELKDQINRMRFSLEGMILNIAPAQYDGTW